MAESGRPEQLPRRGRPGYDADTVLRRAIELFNRQGYDATSVGDLARELGVSKSTIYHHVPSKEHLLAAALDEALDELTGALDRAAAEPGTAEHRLRHAVEASVEILADHLSAVTLLLRVRGNSPVELEALTRRRQIDEQLADLVRAAIEEGALRDDIPAEVTSRLLFGTVNSLVEWYDPEGPMEARALAGVVSRLAFDGLRRR